MIRRLLLLLSFLLCLIEPVLAQDKGLNIVFIPKSSDQDFWVFMRDGVDRAIQEAGNVALTWRGPSYNDDTASQISILNMYSRAGIDAIVIAPTDRVRLAEPISKAAEKGIHVIVVDSAVDGRAHQNFVTTDNFAAGAQAAQHLSELLGGKGRVVVFRTVAGSASTDDRADGFIKYIRDHAPQIAILSDEYGGGSRGKALHSATGLLKRFHNIDGIFAVNESASDGMLRALRNSGLAGRTRFVGFDSTDFLLDGLEKGEVDGLIIQDPRQMGYLAMKAAVAASRGAPVADRIIHTDTALVTRETLRNLDIQRRLVP